LCLQTALTPKAKNNHFGAAQISFVRPDVTVVANGPGIKSLSGARIGIIPRQTKAFDACAITHTPRQPLNSCREKPTNFFSATGSGVARQLRHAAIRLHRGGDFHFAIGPGG